MNEHFIKNIEIKNFKCFEDFKAEGFGRVNLIGGKNNVGKTALMEAVYVNVHAQTVQSFLDALVEIKISRDTLDILDDKNRGKEFDIKKTVEYSHKMFTNSNINKTLYKIEEQDGIKEYVFHFKGKHIHVNINNFSFELEYVKNIRFIDNLGLNKSDFKHTFIVIQTQDKEDVLYKYINEFDKNILNFKIIGGDIPQCKTLSGEYRDLNQFGDGLKHLISIICSLYECDNGYLFIDEVDNGIHYLKLDLLWRIILTISKQQNVQIFATTHSKECIESYARVAKELEDEEVTFINLGKNKENEIKAMLYPYDWFVDSIEQEQEMRGW